MGGTNPSLVEALGAGNPVIAHDNAYNRWVAGNGQFYFASPDDFSQILELINSDDGLLKRAKRDAFSRFNDGLTWPPVLSAYERLVRDEAGLPRGDNEVVAGSLT